MAEPKITWKELVKAQPTLGELLKKARVIKDDKTKPSFCANRVWYGCGGLREELYGLVGWEANRDLPDFVRTSEAFDVAYHKIYHALPDCRNCICF